MAFNIILHYPSDERTQTVRNVVHFETEFGAENTVVVEKTSGDTFEYRGIGLTVTGASEV